jgi:hypothetical protein
VNGKQLVSGCRDVSRKKRHLPLSSSTEDALSHGGIDHAASAAAGEVEAGQSRPGSALGGAVAGIGAGRKRELVAAAEGTAAVLVLECMTGSSVGSMGAAGGGLVGTAKGEDLECSVLSAATALARQKGRRVGDWVHGALLLFPQSLAKAEIVQIDPRPGTPLSSEY